MKLLLLLLALLTVVLSRHESPIELYGPGGRGIFSKTSYNRDSVVACFMELADIDSSGSLGILELGDVLKSGHFLTATEKMLANLNEDRIMRRCDLDGDSVISFDELSKDSCFSTAQLEAIARYICSRAKHEDIGFDAYKARFEEMKAAVERGEPLRFFVDKGVEYVEHRINPHAGRLSRVELPNEQTDMIGAKFEPQYIIAFFYVVFIVIIIVVVVALFG